MVTMPKAPWPPKRTDQEIIDEADAALLDLAKKHMSDAAADTLATEPAPQPEADPTYTAEAQKAAYAELLSFFRDNPDDAEVTTITLDAFANPTKETSDA